MGLFLLHKEGNNVFLASLLHQRALQSNLVFLLPRPETPYRYVLTYTLSQDHLELLLACIRGKNGYSSSPEVVHLKNQVCGHYFSDIPLLPQSMQIVLKLEALLLGPNFLSSGITEVLPCETGMISQKMKRNWS